MSAGRGWVTWSLEESDIPDFSIMETNKTKCKFDRRRNSGAWETVQMMTTD